MRSNLLLLSCFVLWGMLVLPVQASAKDPRAFLFYRDTLKSATDYSSLAEKIYIKTDKQLYTSDETVWFKALLANAADHAPSQLSRVLRADLIDANQRIVESKLIRIGNGTGDGFFQLTRNYPDGVYQLRAYTEFNRNFGEAFVFSNYIRVFSLSGEPDVKISGVSITEAEQGQRRIRATIHAAAEKASDLQVVLEVGGRGDTIRANSNGFGAFVIEQSLPENARLATIHASTGKMPGTARTFLIDTTHIDLEFFPEGGALVHGLDNIIAFKSLDGRGRGKLVQGEILNNKNEVVTSFASNRLGMGSFTLFAADSAERYVARLRSGEVHEIATNYPLPAVTPRGDILSIRQVKNMVFLKITSNHLENEPVVVQVSSRGRQYFELRGRMVKGIYEHVLSCETLPQGVVSYRFLNASGETLVERLTFNNRPDQQLSVLAEADKSSYSIREPTSLQVGVRNASGMPVSANATVLVVNTGASGSSGSPNILSELLLSSDFEDRIEDPGHYFTDGVRQYDLDILLLANRKSYKYSTSPGTLLIAPEQYLSAKGPVSALLSENRKRAGVPLTMMTFGSTRTVQTQVTDSLGRFEFDLDSLEGPPVSMLIQSSNNSGKGRDYSISLEKKSTPAVHFDQSETVELPDSIYRPFIDQGLARQKAQERYDLITGGIALEEVVVSARAMTPQRKKVEETYGKPRFVIEGDAIREKEEKWSYGLFEILMYHFEGRIRIRLVQGVNFFVEHINKMPTLIVVDGIPAYFEDYQSIAAIPASEVKSFEVIEYARNFKSLFCETYPDWCSGGPDTGNVVAIYTHAGQGLWGAKRPAGMKQFTVPVYAASREFTAPRHEDPASPDWKKPDMRALLHWAPNLQTDAEGKLNLSYYNSDVPGKIRVIVEVIAADGRIGYREVEYTVRR